MASFFISDLGKILSKDSSVLLMIKGMVEDNNLGD